VCVCAGCLPGFWFGGLHYLLSQPALRNLEQTNRFLFQQFRLFGLGLFALFVWKSTPEDLSVQFGALSIFVSVRFQFGCRFQFDSFSNTLT
jgi:hypothetical protein